MDANIQLDQPENKPELSLVKTLFLFLLCFCFASLFWISLKGLSLSEVFFLTNIKVSLLKFAFLSFWLVLFLGCFAILVLATEQIPKIILLTLSLSLSIIIFLYPSKVLDILTILVFSIGCLVFSFFLKSISENYIRFVPSHILPKPLGFFFLFLTLSISLHSYIKLQTADMNLLTQPFVKETSKYIANFIFGKNMKFTETTSVHDAAQNLAKNISLGNSTLPMTDLLIQQNLPDLQNASQTVITQQIEQNLLAILGQTEQNPQKTSLLFLLETYIQNLLHPFTGFLPYIIAIIVFFTIRFFSSFWLYGTIIITRLSMEFLKYLGLVKIIHQQQPVERLRIL